MPIPLRRSGSRAPRALSGLARPIRRAPEYLGVLPSVPFPRASRFAAQAGRSPAGRCYEGQLFIPIDAPSLPESWDARGVSFRMSTKSSLLPSSLPRSREIADRFRERLGLNVNNRHITAWLEDYHRVRRGRRG